MNQQSSAQFINHLANNLWKTAVIAGIFLLLFNPSQVFSTPNRTTATLDPPSWLEPRGINVADMVGLVPEDHLQDAIVAYRFEHGIAQYIAGSRQGNLVTVNVKYQMSHPDEVLCLTKTPFAGEFPTVMSEAVVHIFENGNDVTHLVEDSLTYIPAGFQRPATGSTNTFRYATTTMQTTFDNNGGLILPANMGCIIELERGLTGNVTAEFVMNTTPSAIAIDTIHHTVFNAKSAIFVGHNGNENILSLNNQMVAKYQNQMDPFGRHEGWKWWRQSEQVRELLVNQANYVFIKSPPSPVDMYGSTSKPGGGTMRILRSDGTQFSLSVDHVNTMMIPLHISWEDPDFEPNASYLAPFTSFEYRGQYQEFDEVKPPEYFLPPGIPYHPCMTNGGCSDALLAQIWEHEYPVDIYFYKVTRVRGGLHQVPLRAVGKGWTPNMNPAPTELAAPTFADNLMTGGFDYSVYLPTLKRPSMPDPIDPTIVCPCGWFDDQGRMVDVIVGDVD